MEKNVPKSLPSFKMDEEKRLKRQPVPVVHNMGSFQQEQKLPDCNSF